MFFLKCFNWNDKRSRAVKSNGSTSLIYKDVDLLDYKGPNNYAFIGRFPSRKMLSKEERIKTCWFGQRSSAMYAGRVMASAGDEYYFKG